MSPQPAALLGARSLRLAPILALAAVLALFAWPGGFAADPTQFQFHHDDILGTSFDLQVRAADAAQAAQVESIALAEIERLRKILSTYDPESEISHFNTSTGAVKCSPELLDVSAFTMSGT